MENLKKYYETLSVTHIVEDGLDSKLANHLSTICAKYTKLSLSELLSSENTSKVSLSIIEFSTAKFEHIPSIMSKIQATETLLTCDDYRDVKVLSNTINQHIFGVINRSCDIVEIAKRLKSVLVPILTKQKDRARIENLGRIVEAPGANYCIKRRGQIVFANHNMLSSLGVASLVELNALGTDDSSIVNAIFAISNSGETTFVNKKINISYLITCREFGNDQIFYFHNATDTAKHNGALTHVEFIEILKDTLISRSVNEEDMFSVNIKLENSEKIINDHGSEFFYHYFEKFGTFCGFFFKNVPMVFWAADYIVLLVNESDLEVVREKADELFYQISKYKFDEGVVPFIEMSLLDLGRLSISEVISMIENLYKTHLTPAQSANLIIKRSSSTKSAADGKMAMYHLQNIVNKDSELKLSNIYKGMSIGCTSNIEKIEDGDIYVKVEKMQKYLMNLEKSVTIQSKYLPKEIYAEVKYIDKIEPIAILKNPAFLEFSVNNRKNTRVQCDSRIPITVNCGKIVFTGEIFDLSMQAIAIKYKNRVNNDILHNEVKLSFSLPSKESISGMTHLSLKATVNAIKQLDDHTKIITSIKLQPATESALLEYIYARQKELIVELKKLGSVIYS